jgi:hypothetical protein
MSVEPMLATLALIVVLIVCVVTSRPHPVRASIMYLLVGGTLLAALTIPDDDARHLRVLFFARAYPAHTRGREDSAFVPVSSWGWPTFALASAIGAILVAGVFLALDGVVNRNRSRALPESSP